MPAVQETTLLLKALGAKVVAARKAKGLTQKQLGDLADLHRSYISDIEHGTRNLGFINLAALAKALGATISELSRGIEEGTTD
jgi:transcriptional regulator with XRE-family HTH domain